jgi:uncharacterized protein
LQNWLKELSVEDLKIFKDEFDNFLPDSIFDFHVHLWKKDFITKEISKKRFKSNPFLDPDIEEFQFEDYQIVSKELFPNKTYKALIFGLPVKEINLEKNNEYISQVCCEKNFYGLFIPKPDLEKIPDNFFKKKFIGFKPYPDLAYPKLSKNSIEHNIEVDISDYISKKTLEFSHENGLILLLHIPKKERLNNKKNIWEITEIAKKYPRIKIVLAHAGRSYCYNDIKDSIEYLKIYKNIYVDTAMINNYEVNKVIIEELGTERILYGSDLAVAILKGKNVDINNKHYFVTSTPRPWSLSSDSIELKNFTFFIYEIIRSIKIACKSLQLSNENIKNIFYNNSIRLIEDISIRTAGT